MNGWLQRRIFMVFAILIMMPVSIYGQSAVPDRLENYRIIAAAAVTTDSTVELPLKAINPNPSNGATGRPVNLVLSWANGGGATSYDVYLGRTDAPNIVLATNRTETSYNLGSLVQDADYYWRVDSRNSAGKTTGDVWRFTTAPPKPSVSVNAVDASASEPGTDTASVRFSRTGSTASALNVYFNITGTARNESDYNRIASPIRIPAGQTDAYLTITPKDDDIYEGDENVIITVLSNSAYDRGSPLQAWVIIHDNDDVGPVGPALDNDTLSFTTGGNAAWYGQYVYSWYGGSSAQSGAIGDNQESWVETSLYGPEKLRFNWQVSSVQNSGYLEFWVDGALRERISGEVGWTQVSADLESGHHALKWRFVQNGGTGFGWLDKVETPLRSMVKHLYDAALSRNPESESAYQYWAWHYDEIRSRQIDAIYVFREVGRRFLLSEEYQGRNPGNSINRQFAIDCYKTYLWRTPNESEIAAAIAKTQNRDEYVTVFTRSSEFTALVRQRFEGQGGLATESLVGQMFYGIFTGEGGMAFIDRIRSPEYGVPVQALRVNQALDAEKLQTVTNVAKELFQRLPATLTSEQLADRLYLCFMARYPSASEREYWTGVLSSGTKTLAQCIESFANSTEFKNLVKTFIPTAIASATRSPAGTQPGRSGVGRENWAIYE